MGAVFFAAAFILRSTILCRERGVGRMSWRILLACFDGPTCNSVKGD